MTQPAKEHWGTRMGVILAVTGSAVGLGNFLRFPGKAAQYEGGAFMIPYFVALFLLGLPIAWSEWSMGRFGGARGFNSLPGIFRVVWRNRLSPYLGSLGLLIPVAVYMYYVYIEAWCLGYSVSFLSGRMEPGAEQPQAFFGGFFERFTGIGEDGSVFDLSRVNWWESSLLFLALCFALNFVLIYRGLTKGIEAFCRYAMPALVVCAVIVLVRVLTLGAPVEGKPEQNVMNGLGYMWNPSVDAQLLADADKALPGLLASYQAPQDEAPAAADAPLPRALAAADWRPAAPAALDRALAETGWNDRGEGRFFHADSRLVIERQGTGAVRARAKTFWEALMNAKMWLEAAGQIFFSLSVGFGIIACYASYMKRNDDIALSSVTACAGNEFCEVALGGLITIPAAFVFLGAAGTVGGTFGLGFNTLPMVFDQMPAGRYVGAIFFFLLFLAAVTSSLSMLQPAIALLEEGLGLGRKASVSLLGLVTVLGTGFVVYFSAGLTALDTIDFWVGSVGIYVLATIQVLLFGWVMGIAKGHEELQRGAEIRVPRAVMYLVKYVSPVYLIAIFALWLYQSAGSYVAAIAENRVVLAALGLVGIVLIFFTLMVARAVARWRRLEAASGGGA